MITHVEKMNMAFMKDNKKLSFKERALFAYKIMYSSRVLDEKMLILLKQGKSYFHIGCMGHEAIQVAMALNMNIGFDYLFPYYRDQAFCLALGQTPYECLLAFLGKKHDPHSGGRQMPMHYGNKKLNIPSSSSSTGTQFLQAVGCALANKRLYENKELEFLPVTVCTCGDGTTSQGEFYEAISWAAKDNAPIVFLVENNGYAISVNINEQRPGGKIAENFKNFHALNVKSIDGLSFEESFLAAADILDKVRKGQGPFLLEAKVVRLLPHSSSDDQRKYRPKDELEKEKTQDPLMSMADFLLKEKFVTKKKLDVVKHDIEQTINESIEDALKASEPEGKTATLHVFANEKEPPEVDAKVNHDLPPVVMVDAINKALSEEMVRNPKVLVFGEDVAHDKGGVFTATRGLTKKFGNDRCFNSPLAEASIVGVGIGYALLGFKPVVEIQFADYIWTAMMQIRNELATFRYRSNNDFSTPMVIRVPIGGYIHGGLCHSQNIEATFAHFPGLKIAIPSNALDAYGLLKAAIRSNDPVLFLEHKALYRQNFAKSLLPENTDYLLPFGKHRVVRDGKDICIVTYGILVQRALEAALKLKEEGIDVMVLDLRTIVPYDEQGVFAAVKKTGKVLVLHEDMKFVGFGAEIAGGIAENCFSDLDAPVYRLAAKDAPVPYSSSLENVILPQVEDIVAKARELAEY